MSPQVIVVVEVDLRGGADGIVGRREIVAALGPAPAGGVVRVLVDGDSWLAWPQMEALAAFAQNASRIEVAGAGVDALRFAGMLRSRLEARHRTDPDSG